ncbi:MAG: hypothetical protein RLZZ573_1176, partial [Pseudomonadota bacterium]
YSTQPPTVSMGSAVLLKDLKLTGLRDASDKGEKGRQFACPHCGASLTVQLAASKSLTCASCNSIIDVSQGIGGELSHALQDEPIQPLIPLGSTGLLQGAQWQVVGFQHRMGTDPSDPDEHFGWEEYLLFNARRGFTFLVDSTEGWSIVKPATGAPVVGSNGQSATYLGTHYQLMESYSAETNYVQGEFYWQVSRGQKTANRDYANGKSLLSMEQSPNELTWSVGGKIDSDVVVKAFRLEAKQDLLKRSDAGPFVADKSVSWKTIVVLIVILLIFSSLTTRCARCDPAVENCSTSGRTSAGSFGGFSSGGGHK